MSQSKETFIVECMNCGGCVSTIKHVVGQLDGVTGVDVNLSSKEVSVEFDANVVDVQRLKEVIMQSSHWCFVSSVQKAKRAKRLGMSA